MSDPSAIPPPARVYELATGAWVSQALGVAAELGVADVLAGGPRPVGEIAAEVGADASTLYRLLRALADRQVFTELDGQRFALTEVSEVLRSGVPGSMRAWAVMLARPFHQAAWSGLADSVRTGEPAFDRVHGRPAFDYLAANPEDGRVLNEAMTSASAGAIAPTVAAYDFGAYGKVVDVGGGQGALIAAILAAYPGVHGVLFDLPNVIADAGGPLEDAGVARRCDLVGGDFLTEVPSGGDAYVLSNILHDWDDDRAERILATCRAAMNPGGRLLLVEAVLPDGPAPNEAKWIDLEMLIMGSGRQRTEGEYRRLFGRTGFALTRVAPTPAPFDLVEAVAQ